MGRPVARSRSEAASAQEAAVRVADSAPSWEAVVTVAEATGRDGTVVLHAGPPFRSREEIPPPVRHSLEAACLFEGWASSWDGAAGLIGAGAVTIAPAQTAGMMVPLCGVASPSMAALQVRDPRSGTRCSAVLNEGQAHATRFGVRDPALIAHLRWLNGAFAAELAGACRRPIPLFPVLARSLDEGDDGHSQTAEGTRLLTSHLPRGALSGASKEFLDGCPAFALNLWMAAVACALASAGVSPTPLIIRAGANGSRFGVQTARSAGHWVTCPGPIPTAGDAPAKDVLPAVGDSALLDLFGLGGQLRADGAPLMAESAHLGGRRVCLSAQTLADSHYESVVRLGMIDRDGVRGRVSGGTITVPRSLMKRAAEVAPDHG